MIQGTAEEPEFFKAIGIHIPTPPSNKFCLIFHDQTRTFLHGAGSKPATVECATYSGKKEKYSYGEKVTPTLTSGSLPGKSRQGELASFESVMIPNPKILYCHRHMTTHALSLPGHF